MSAYQVVCVDRAPAGWGGHDHITHLGLNGYGQVRRITVSEAVAQLSSPYGDRYYTISPSTGRRTEVVPAGCSVCGHRPHVRTAPDAVWDNNLESLRRCLLV